MAAPPRLPRARIWNLFRRADEAARDLQRGGVLRRASPARKKAEIAKPLEEAVDQTPDGSDRRSHE